MIPLYSLDKLLVRFRSRASIRNYVADNKLKEKSQDIVKHQLVADETLPDYWRGVATHVRMYINVFLKDRLFETVLTTLAADRDDMEYIPGLMQPENSLGVPFGELTDWESERILVCVSDAFRGSVFGNTDKLTPIILSITDAIIDLVERRFFKFLKEISKKRKSSELSVQDSDTWVIYKSDEQFKKEAMDVIKEVIDNWC